MFLMTFCIPLASSQGRKMRELDPEGPSFSHLLHTLFPNTRPFAPSVQSICWSGKTVFELSREYNTGSGVVWGLLEPNRVMWLISLSCFSCFKFRDGNGYGQQRRLNALLIYKTRLLLDWSTVIRSPNVIRSTNASVGCECLDWS